MDTNYNITKDQYFKDYITNNPRISENTIERYRKAIFKFSIALNLTLEEIVTNCKEEQDIETEEIINVAEDENGNKITKRRITRFDVNGKDSTIKKYFTQYEKYCKQKGNKNSTINSETEAIRTVLMGCGVRLPKLRELEDDSDNWNLLTKEDFNYALQDATLVHLSLAHFLVGTGMRVGDALKLSIGDFMEATKEYHDFIEVEDFIDNAPQDMIGTFVFNPTKTKRYDIKCITFNSAESSNIILQNLRQLKNEYYPTKNKESGLELKISKNDALFGSKKAKFKTAMKSKTIAEQWGKKNKKLRAWKINQIKQKIENGEISADDYEKEIKKIPRFHAHACRKYFQSTISKNCGDLRICALMEGHKPPLKTDKSYIKKNIADIKEIYLKAHDDLCLSKVETKIVTNKETEELNKKVSEADEKIQALTNENKEKDKEIAELKQQINQTQEQMAETNKAIEKLQLKREKPIRNTITDYFFDNYREDILQKEYEKDGKNHIGYKKCVVICELAYEIALENKSEFSDDEAYLNKLIKKAIVKCSFNPDLIIPKYKEIHDKNADIYEVNTTMNNIAYDIMIIIGNNKDAWEMVNQEQKALKNKIIKHLQNSKYDINAITGEEKKQIAEDVMMEFLDMI